MYKQDFLILKKLLVFFWPYNKKSIKIRVVCAILAMVCAKLIIVTVPIIYKMIIDYFTVSGIDDDALIFGVVSLITAYAIGRFIGAVLIQLRDIMFVSVLHHARRSLALDSFRHIIGMSFEFFTSNKVGEIQQKVDRGIRAVSSLTDYLLFSIVPTIFEIMISVIAIAVFLSPVHALVITGCAMGYIVFTILITEWRLKFRKRMNSDENRSKGIAVDAIINFEIIKLQSAEDFEARRYHKALTQFEDSSVLSARSLAAVNIGQTAIIAMGLTYVLITVGMGVLNETYTISQFSMVNIYLLQIFIPLGMFGFVYRQVRFAMTDLIGMYDLMDQYAPQQIAENISTKTEIGGINRIEFKKVSFVYPNNDELTLKDISLRIESGRVIGIVGPTGAGKTTLLRLFFGIYEPNLGSILIDGTSLNQISSSSFRRQLGIVPQDAILFHDTLRHNIGYGLTNISDARIMEAGHIAEISTDIMASVSDLDNVVGERGSRISGGQRQRVALARALVRKPSVLIFDEGTASLDTITERRIIERIYALAREKNYAVVIVTHKLSNVTDADELVVIDNGRIVDRGTHTELMNAAGKYSQLQKGSIS